MLFGLIVACQDDMRGGSFEYCDDGSSGQNSFLN